MRAVHNLWPFALIVIAMQSALGHLNLVEAAVSGVMFYIASFVCSRASACAIKKSAPVYAGIYYFLTLTYYADICLRAGTVELSSQVYLIATLAVFSAQVVLQHLRYQRLKAASVR